MNNISFLKIMAGEWVGDGVGEYPTIDPFEYREILRFTLDEHGSLLHYEQRTHRRDDPSGELIPSHWETGFIMLRPDNRIELANAQSGGRVEVLEGTIEPTPGGGVLDLHSSHFANDLRMLESTRKITLLGDSLHYEMFMRTTSTEQLALHLDATLSRQG